METIHIWLLALNIGVIGAIMVMAGTIKALLINLKK